MVYGFLASLRSLGFRGVLGLPPLLLAFLGACVSASPSPAQSVAVGVPYGVPYGVTDGYARRAGVDVLAYDLAIEIPAEGEGIVARAAILYEATGEEGISYLELDFGEAMTVDSVAVDGKAVPFRHDAEGLSIKTPGTEAGARSEAVVWYRGRPADGLIFGRTEAGVRTVFADNWADRGRHWFPSVDHPADKARVAFDVTAPASLEVVANGALVERVDLGDGRARTRWSETAEIPTYCMVIGVTDFVVIPIGEAAGVEVSAWAYPADSAAAAMAFSRGAEMVAFYDSLIGPYPYEKMAHVQSTTRYGGMENASAIFYPVRFVAGAREDREARAGSAEIVAHETAHMWFGDAVTEADWNHLWLSEGFADYFAAVFFEFRGGPDGDGPAELARRMRAMRDEVLEYQPTSPDESVVDSGVGPGRYESLLTDLKYEKGAWVLHMARDVIGDGPFFEGIRDFYGSLRDGVAWSADLERALENASGEDLGWFFRQWLARPGHPRLAVDLADAGEGRSTVTVRQVQPGEPFRFPVDLRLEWEGGSRVERVWLEERSGSWTFDVPAAPTGVTVDPDVRLLWEPAGGSP